MLFTKQGIERALKFAGVSIAILVVEIAFLYTLVEFFGWNEVIAAAFALVLALFINYTVSRKIVFRETEQSFFKGLTVFYGFAVINITIITTLMFLAVEVLQYNYLVSRLVIGSVMGFVTYLNNLYFNFKVHEKNN